MSETKPEHQNSDDAQAMSSNAKDVDQKKMKRKKSFDNYNSESINNNEIGYEIVEHENKRQKIEIKKCHQMANNKENEITTQTTNKANATTTTPATAVIAAAAAEKILQKQMKSNEPDKLRIKYENIHTTTVQKLTAQAEQLRSEISTLRTALANEQQAVRTLR